MKGLLYVGYLALGVFQFFAIVAGFRIWLNLGTFFAAIIAFFIIVQSPFVLSNLIMRLVGKLAGNAFFNPSLILPSYAPIIQEVGGLSRVKNLLVACFL